MKKSRQKRGQKKRLRGGLKKKIKEEKQHLKKKGTLN